MMDIFEAIKARHSVRAYTTQAIEGEVREKLLTFIEECNRESGLCMQLVFDEPKGFSGFLARYGKFVNVHNYLAIVGKDSADLDEKTGYFGEKFVLYVQMLGLNSCWTGLTYSKVEGAFEVGEGEKVSVVICVGYGQNQGREMKRKSREKVMRVDCEDIPDWFLRGVDAALLAPTAMHQQRFVFSLRGNVVEAKAKFGFYTKVDLGIVKYHFEIGAGKENFVWKEG